MDGLWRFYRIQRHDALFDWLMKNEPFVFYHPRYLPERARRYADRMIAKLNEV